MKAFSIRNIPDHVYAGLQVLAKDNRRSLQEQIKLILEKEVELCAGSFMTGAAGWRKQLQNRNRSDTVASVRKDRDR